MRAVLSLASLCAFLGLVVLPAGARSGMHPNRPILVPILLTVNPTTVTGGSPATFTVSVTSLTWFDREVAITTDHPDVFVDLPQTVVVPGGSWGVSFAVQTFAVPAVVSAAVTATGADGSSTAVVTVTP